MDRHVDKVKVPDMSQEEAVKIFGVIEMDEKTIDNVRKNKKVVAKLQNIISLAGGKASKS